MSAPRPGTVMRLTEPFVSGRCVIPMGTTRLPCRVSTVTVIGPVTYEPGMTRVRFADGSVRRTLTEYLTDL